MTKKNKEVWYYINSAFAKALTKCPRVVRSNQIPKSKFNLQILVQLPWWVNKTYIFLFDLDPGILSYYIEWTCFSKSGQDLFL